ncbi:MAG: 7-cyano-7-deazaguanine synthase QueC [Burkholderiales bacterium]|nr:7-cyano-7-deazaguanine synthase QueC [Burkholderiales bacterium]
MKIIVLSSGGVDSSVCLALALKDNKTSDVLSLSFFYGQRHDKELESATKIANYYGVEHYLMDLSAILQYSNCPLLKKNPDKIEHSTYAHQLAVNDYGRVTTYVPFRNGLMLSSAAALAQSLFPQEECQIYIGSHADDAMGNAYADCSPQFNESMGEAIEIGTYGLVKLKAPLVNMTKAQVVGEGLALKVPFELTWSCYEGGDKPCGKCGTCRERIEAFRKNGVEDPLEYEP